MTKFIADLGSNINQDLDRAYALIDEAKEADCWGIKLQYFEVEKLYHPSADIHFDLLKNMEMPLEWIYNLAEYASSVDLKVGVTFFHTGIMTKFDPSIFDFIKISSFDTSRDDLIREALICTGKRLFISTGLMTIPEIVVLNANIAKWESELAIPHKEINYMHCVSQYPAHDAHMGFMREMVKEGWPVGYSDHTTTPHAMIHAGILGAEYIEFHLDLDDRLGRENIGHCWEPKNIKAVIESVNRLDDFFTEKVVTDEMLKNKADPEDGMRPIKRFRK